MIVRVRAVANCYFKDVYHVCGDYFDFELPDGERLPDCLERVESVTDSVMGKTVAATRRGRVNQTSQ